MRDEIAGKAYVVGDNIDTDGIIPGRYLGKLASVPVEMYPEILRKHAMEDLDPKYPSFLDKEKRCPYKIIVAGRNFGHGSSREHAQIALKGAGIEVVVAPSFARIFYRNCINGAWFPPIESEEDLSKQIATGDELKIKISERKIVNVTKGEEHSSKPFDILAKNILDAGGLTQYNLRRI